MKIHFLSDQNIKTEIKLIKTSIDRNKDRVFIYTGNKMLNDYIKSLSENNEYGLDNEYLYKLRICYEREDLSLELIKYQSKEGILLGAQTTAGKDLVGRKKNISSISKLICDLELDCSYFIIVKNDNYEHLNFILQQLIYIDFPQEKLEVMLQSEVKSITSTNLLINNSKQLFVSSEKVIKLLDSFKIDKKFKSICKRIEYYKAEFKAIAHNLERIADHDIRFGIVASKKAGKSVFTNCLLEDYISPSSNLLATPNVTLYKKSSDNKYHCEISKTNKTFGNAKDLNNYLVKNFKESSKNINWHLEDMTVEYATNPKYIKPNIVIFDTPGPDAAKSIHKKTAYEALEKLDIAIFIVDYSKYLQSGKIDDSQNTDDKEEQIGEAEYLIDIVNKFSSDDKYRMLIIVLNKVDVRFDDAEGNYSIVSALDFIKTRLGSKPFQDALKKQKKAFKEDFYKRILLFPVCSLEYLNTIITEKANIKELNNSEGVSIDRLKELEKEKRDIQELHWLKMYADKLEYIGINNFSFDTFKQDSGIPNLMEYITKIIKIYSSKNELIADLRSRIKQIEENNILFKEDKENIKEDINGLDNQINKLKNSINSIKKEICDLKDLYNNSFINDSKRFAGIISEFKFIDDFYNSYLDSIKKKINFNDTEFDLYWHFFDYIWSKIKNLNDKNSNINGKLINSLIDKYNFSSTAYKFFKMKIDSIKEIVIDDFYKIKDKAYKRLYKIRNELKSFSDSFNAEFKKYNLDFELDELNIEEISFNTYYSISCSFYQSFSDFNLYNRIKTAFEKTVGAKLYNIITFGNADEMEASLSLATDYTGFRTIFDKNVKTEYCLKWASNLIYMQSELIQIIKNDIFEPNYNKIAIEVDKVKDYFESLKSCFAKLKSDVTDRISEFKVKIAEIEKSIENKQKQKEKYNRDYDTVAKLQYGLSRFITEIKKTDKVLYYHDNKDFNNPLKSILDGIRENEKSSDSLVAKTRDPINNNRDLKKDCSLTSTPKVLSVKILSLLLFIIILYLSYIILF